MGVAGRYRLGFSVKHRVGFRDVHVPGLLVERVLALSLEPLKLEERC